MMVAVRGRRTYRVAMVTTHPIQYQTPWLRLLGAREDVELQVFFGMLPSPEQQGADFGVAFAWDLPLLDGLRYTVLENVAKQPGLTTFGGCDTPSIHHHLRNGAYDAVIVNGWGSKSALQTLVACRRLGVPCLVRGEANNLRRRALYKRIGHRCLLVQYAAFLAIGKQNRSYYLKSGVDPKRIFDTPYCVDNARFASQAEQIRARESKQQLRASLGLKPESTTLLFSGKFIDKKRPQDVIDAVRLLHAQGKSDLQLLMVGEGPLSAELRSRATDLPVTFAGFLNQQEIVRAYVASDCLVLPSDAGETWGLVVNEAMACGVPALVSDQVGCAEDLVSGQATGSVFPCTDVAALAQQIQAAESRAGQWADWGNKAQTLVSSRYTFERVVDGVVAALQQAIE